MDDLKKIFPLKEGLNVISVRRDDEKQVIAFYFNDVLVMEDYKNNYSTKSDSEFLKELEKDFFPIHSVADLAFVFKSYVIGGGEAVKIENIPFESKLSNQYHIFS
jgi:hypothetical protein